MRKEVKTAFINLICIMMLSFNIVLPSQSLNTDQFIIIDIEEVRYIDTVDVYSNSFFTFSIRVNNESIQTTIWNNFPYVTEPNFSLSTSLTDDVSTVYIEMELWITDDTGSFPCDLTNSNQETNTSNTSIIIYDIKTGHWSGDDYLGDISGYGRLNGCDDGSIYAAENDCELWFDIYQNDYDNDGIPYWTETEIYHTDPTVDDRGRDDDSDGVPIEWEWKWGYDPLVAENHGVIDPDNDSITNFEEYLVSSLGSDPFRKDIFLELDWMDNGPNGEKSVFPELSKELLRNPFHQRNYVFHVDTGILGGGDIIPFNDNIDSNELLAIYNEFFIHNGSESWKRGIFHYGVYVYDCSPKGYAFSGDVDPHWGYHPGTNGFMIASSRMERNGQLFQPTVEYFYGSATMHEMGHNFGFRHGNPNGVDVQLGKYPWHLMYYVYRNYKSIMNYRYTYKIFDYSDGSHGFLDNDDWGTLNLSYFEQL